MAREREKICAMERTFSSHPVRLGSVAAGASLSAPLLHTVDDPSAYVELAIDPLFGGAKDTLRYTKKDP